MDAHLKNLALTMGVEPYSFNPYENANDDYAVLEWMREQSPIKKEGYLQCEYVNELDSAYAYEYEIGDYARAALKVLE